MSFVFYDTETTGTETAFDQLLQFAAIKTDDDLNEVERFNIRCRLLPHVVPSPGALRATRIRPATLTDPSLPSHYEAITRIRAKLLKWSPAVFIGYNSFGFDEELLRQALFQTLYPAYLTNTNGNARADVLRVAHATSVYAPNAISVPIDDRGRQTFRLERLAPANGYMHDHAHEAMADVLATIHVARLVRERAPDVWQSMDRAARKTAVIERMAAEPMLSLTERYYGRAYSWLVTHCGENPDYDSQLAVFDLSFDPDEYLGLSMEQLVDVLNTSPKVIRSLRANAQPILMPADAAPEGTKALQVSASELQRRVEVIRGNPDFRARVGRALALRYADKEPSPYVERRIHDGFPGPQDQSLMERFQRAKWADRPALVEQIEDARLIELADRLIYFEQPQLLSDAKAAKLKAWVADRVMTEDENVPWMTVGKAMREADDLLKDASSQDVQLLKEVKDFLYELADQYA